MKVNCLTAKGWDAAIRAGVLLPCSMFDADGCEIKLCFAWDSESGEVERFATLGKGESGRTAIALTAEGSPIVIRETRPLPWRLVPLSGS